MMDKARNLAGQEIKKSSKRKPYQQPTVIYQGKITIRAGSPLSSDFGPPSPFDFTDDS
jgi:hypothetical protein